MNEVHKEQFWFPIDIYFLTVSKMLMYKTRLRANIHNLCSCRRKAARLPNGRKRDNHPTHRLPKGERRENIHGNKKDLYAILHSQNIVPNP